MREQVLPVFSATHTLTSWNVVEVMVALGQGQVVLTEAPNNQVHNGGRANFTASLSLSPPAALTLYKQLAEFVTDYERKFGPIPSDPALDPPKQVGNVVGLGRVDPSALGEQVVDENSVAQGSDRLAPAGPNNLSNFNNFFRRRFFDPVQEVVKPVVTDGPEKPVTDPGGSSED